MVNMASKYPGLKHYLDNGYLNYERLAKYFEANSEWQKEKESQTVGLTIVIQFMCKQVSLRRVLQKFKTKWKTMKQTNERGLIRRRERERWGDLTKLAPGIARRTKRFQRVWQFVKNFVQFYARLLIPFVLAQASGLTCSNKGPKSALQKFALSCA